MTSFKKLTENKNIKTAIKTQTSLCFFDLPRQFVVGTAQAMWMFTGNSSYKVYQYGKIGDNLKEALSNIKASYPKEKILFITWDYENLKFKIL